ncbi:hypothetical protein UlMin_004035, partial [Ulmus minor]
TKALKEMPPQICKMKSLERLSDFVLGENDSWRIKELGELPLLGGRLRISGLHHIVDVKDVLEANLKDKKFLSQLILRWDEGNITSTQQEQDREVLEALQPHTNLKRLTIQGYRGTIFPDWVGHESFCNMVQVVLFDCRNVCRLPPLGQLSSLRGVLIECLDSVVRIGNEFCVSSSTTTNRPFTSLAYLEFRGMTWEEWSFSSDRLGQEGGVFPSLTELHIRFCCNLIVGLPDCHLPSLKSISIEYCDKMVGVFVCQSRQEMDTNAFPSLQSIQIWRCKKLWKNRRKWGLERLPSLMTFSLGGIEEEVDSFPEEGLLLPTTLTLLSITHFKKLQSLNGRAFQHLTSLQDLLIGGCEELECLPQEGLPLSLSSLGIYDCPEVLKQRCQRGTGEDWPKIQHISKIEIR